MYKRLRPRTHKELPKQSGDGVQGGKVTKEKGDVKLKRRKHKEWERLDREVTESLLERLEVNLVIREETDDQV